MPPQDRRAGCLSRLASGGSRRRVDEPTARASAGVSLRAELVATVDPQPKR